MDAASSNSVDDIRALRESVAFAPISGHRKIYILDEAHMLSTAAWNAFLKTLEEPPPNTLFVLATTDAQKIPATVIDRCHRFDFARPSAEQIATVLRRAAAAEKIEVPDAALSLLARHASGSFRDALGMLEQLDTYSGGEISLADVLAVLGISDSELLFGALDAIASADPRATLLAVASAIDGGRDPAAFIRELETHARELLIIQTLGGAIPPEIALTADHDARLSAQAASVGPAVLVRFLDLLAQALIAVRAGSDARTQLELAAIRAARPDLDPTAAAITARLERLEGATATPHRAAPATQPEATHPPATPHAVAPSAQHEATQPRPGPSAQHEATQPPTPPEPGQAPQEPTADQPRDAAHEPTPPAQESNGHKATVPAEPREEVATTPGLIASTNDVGESLPLTLQAFIEAWPAVVATLRASNAMLGAVIEDAQPVELDGSRLVLAFAADAAFLRRKAQDGASRKALSAAVTQVTGRALSLDYELRAPEAEEMLSEEELVRRLKDEFDAEELPSVDEEAH
jgi:DNA polymerase-3 subunit gamma/tau